jgi:phage terminase small subunit
LDECKFNLAASFVRFSSVGNLDERSLTSISRHMDHRKLQNQHFTALKEKYQVEHNQSAEPDIFLYFILRKAELGIQITEIEFQWLIENRFTKTAGIIDLQQYKTEELQRLEAELLRLRVRYCIPEDAELTIANPISSLLWKVESGGVISASELELLNHDALVDTKKVIQEVLQFSQLKVTYKAAKYLDRLPEEPLFSILKKLDVREQLTDAEADWLLAHDFYETLDIYWQQENERKAEREFSVLKAKYQVEAHPDTSISSPLYTILKKLDAEEALVNRECKWLSKQNLNTLVTLAQHHKDKILFASLKSKYQATQCESSEPTNPLFLILKRLEALNSETSMRNWDSQVIAGDIQWLSDQGLAGTAQILIQTHFRMLKTKYRIFGALAIEPFYEIMLRLERGERLDPKQVVQLIEEGRLSRTGNIAIAHYRLEAIFYEKEYRRTGNRWNLASASSNWRKAGKPEKALQVTETLNWDKVKELDLKAALLVTRGAAFRDLEQLDEAEQCATKAMEYQPESHQPFTLMGALSYDRGNYTQGDDWFEMAVERGATDTDNEIEKIVRMTKQKEKRREVVEYLLNKDPDRYKWAKVYLKPESL